MEGSKHAMQMGYDVERMQQAATLTASFKTISPPGLQQQVPSSLSSKLNPETPPIISGIITQ